MPFAAPAWLESERLETYNTPNFFLLSRLSIPGLLMSMRAFLSPNGRSWHDRPGPGRFHQRPLAVQRCPPLVLRHFPITPKHLVIKHLGARAIPTDARPVWGVLLQAVACQRVAEAGTRRGGGGRTNGHAAGDRFLQRNVRETADGGKMLGSLGWDRPASVGPGRVSPSGGCSVTRDPWLLRRVPGRVHRSRKDISSHG